MCFLAVFLVKYVFIITNLLFSLLGLAVIGLGIAVLHSLRELNEILPVNLIPIGLIVLGAIGFLIGFLACCGAIKESRCMLISYAIIVVLIAAVFIYLAVVIFGNMATIEDTVDQWIASGFNTQELRPAFNILEATFRCCGTAGSSSYTSINQPIPPTCCDGLPAECLASEANAGCSVLVGNWFSTFGSAVGGVLVFMIFVQLVAVSFAILLTNSISNKRRRNIS